jgi:choline dehydrogenase-like flavoprotein
MNSNLYETTQAPRSFDVVVIGGGTVGLPFSHWVSQNRRLQIACLESGRENDFPEIHPLNLAEHSESTYLGAAEGRFRCLGGTSTRWGGALIPYQAADLEHSDWPMRPEELNKYIAPVESLFSLEGGPYEDPAFPYDLGGHYIQRLAKWPAFQNRNVYKLLRSRLRESTNLVVQSDATVTQISLTHPTKGARVTFKTADGLVSSLNTKSVVIAAGAIETTRLALLLHKENARFAKCPSPALGRFFSDHISLGVAAIRPKNRRQLNRLLGWRFGQRGRMRNLRFELAPNSTRRRGTPPHFVHISPKSKTEGAFEALRDFYRALQKGDNSNIVNAMALARHFPWICRAAYWRFAEKRLLFPKDAELVVHVVMEQVPRETNRITLSEHQTDSHGVPTPKITWSVHEEDLSNIHEASLLFQSDWNNSAVCQLGDVVTFPNDALKESQDGTIGVFHPTGSTRISNSQSQGVVDRDLKMFSHPQVYLLSTATIPSGGGSNPTMLLLMLASRLADHLSAQHP